MSKIVKGDDFRWKNLETASLLRVKLNNINKLVGIIQDWASTGEPIFFYFKD